MKPKPYWRVAREVWNGILGERKDREVETVYDGFMRLMVFSFLPKKCALYFKKCNLVFVS